MHKSNPDLNINPKAAPAGATRESGRKVKKAALEEVCAVGKAARPVEKGVAKYGDVDHQIKKARVDGVHSQVTKNQIHAIVQQTKVMWENKDILIGVHGKEECNSMIVAFVVNMPGVEQVVSPKKAPAKMVDLMRTPTSGDSDDDE